MSMLTAKLRQQAGQEGHDGEPWDSMSEAADEIDRLERELAEAQKESEGHRIQLGVCSIERTAEWRRAENAENQVKVLREALAPALHAIKAARFGDVSPQLLESISDKGDEALASIKGPT